MNLKLDFGAVFDRTVDIYKSHFKTLALTALAVFGVVFVLSVVLVLVAFSGSAGTAIFATFVLAGIAMIAQAFYTGMVVRVVQFHGGGREHSVGELFESVKPVIVPLILTSVMVGFFTIIGFLALIVPGLILMTHFVAVSAIVVVERVNYMDAIKRSWKMVKGNAWTVFAILIVMTLALMIGRGILGAIGVGLGDIGRPIMDLVANVLLAPFPAIAGAVMYFMLGGAGAPATPAAAPAAPQAPPGGIAPPPTPGTGPAVAGSKPPPPPPPAG